MWIAWKYEMRQTDDRFCPLKLHHMKYDFVMSISNWGAYGYQLVSDYPFHSIIKDEIYKKIEWKFKTLTSNLTIYMRKVCYSIRPVDYFHKRVYKFNKCTLYSIL